MPCVMQGKYFKEESDTQRLAQRVLQRNLSQRSFSIIKMDLEDNYVDALDPEKLIQCPYDRYHQIRACRFPYHLIKCRKNHPDIAQQLATCPFNARHQVPRAEIRHHISSCDDKSCIEQDIVSQSNNCHREMNTVSMWQPSPCDEDWDKELQEQSDSVFVWGTFNSGINNSPGSSVVMELKNNLMPGMRAPRSLPYSLSWKSTAARGMTLLQSRRRSAPGGARGRQPLMSLCAEVGPVEQGGEDDAGLSLAEGAEGVAGPGGKGETLSYCPPSRA
ncbi:gametocyte-specific factor 1-like isoform X2 [Mauremys reevesii]|uniref:gametocyte-specific factor 1-like isoform X2 n=1 Tax=Mauremys reevesii TaxID=260615 RepID=UPI00193F72A4|nr:gametocyte-specific factor 1-like isoform X2 [Mauremys reevesii]